MQNDEPVSAQPDDRLSAQMPDPRGSPQPVDAADPVLNVIAAVGVGLVALGGLLLPIFVSTTQTCGATRSARIEWEYREQEIERAAQARENPRPPATLLAAGENTDEPSGR